MSYATHFSKILLIFRWLAPECIQRESEFSTKTDVWAFGVVIFEVYNNAEKLFAGEEDIAILRKIKKANMPTIENRTKVPAMQAVLSSIWTRKPDDRPEMQKVLEKLVAALVPIQPDDLKRLQINSLKGVSRTQMPVSFWFPNYSNACFFRTQTWRWMCRW